MRVLDSSLSYQVHRQSSCGNKFYCKDYAHYGLQRSSCRTILKQNAHVHQQRGSPHIEEKPSTSRPLSIPNSIMHPWQLHLVFLPFIVTITHSISITDFPPCAVSPVNIPYRNFPPLISYPSNPANKPPRPNLTVVSPI